MCGQKASLSKPFLSQICTYIWLLFSLHSPAHLFQSYIQSFRERQGEGCAYPGARLSGAHTAVDIDYDCGSTVPLTSGAVPNPRVWWHTVTHSDTFISLSWCCPWPDLCVHSWTNCIDNECGDRGSYRHEHVAKRVYSRLAHIYTHPYTNPYTHPFMHMHTTVEHVPEAWYFSHM